MNGETSSGSSLGWRRRALVPAPHCLVNWWFTRNASGLEPSTFAAIGREQLTAGLTQHRLTKTLPHGVGFPYGKDPSLRDSLGWGGCMALNKAESTPFK